MRMKEISMSSTSEQPSPKPYDPLNAIQSYQPTSEYTSVHPGLSLSLKLSRPNQNCLQFQKIRQSYIEQRNFVQNLNIPGRKNEVALRCLMDILIQNQFGFLNQQMSDQEVAFDDWEAEAEAVAEEVKNQPPAEVESEQGIAERAEEVQKQKVEVIDPRQALLNRISQYRSLQGDKYDDYLEEVRTQSSNSDIKTSNQILKNDKDFSQFAKSVGKRLNEHATYEEVDDLDQNNLFVFAQELLLLLYAQTQWRNIQAAKEKLKIVKKQRKDEETRAKKQREKEQRLKKQQKNQENQESKSPKKGQGKVQEEDIFDGATFVNSKQQEEERKNKEKVKVQTPKNAVEDDDDDFM